MDRRRFLAAAAAVPWRQCPATAVLERRIT